MTAPPSASIARPTAPPPSLSSPLSSRSARPPPALPLAGRSSVSPAPAPGCAPAACAGRTLWRGSSSRPPGRAALPPSQLPTPHTRTVRPDVYAVQWS